MCLIGYVMISSAAIIVGRFHLGGASIVMTARYMKYLVPASIGTVMLVAMLIRDRIRRAMNPSGEAPPDLRAAFGACGAGGAVLGVLALLTVVSADQGLEKMRLYHGYLLSNRAIVLISPLLQESSLDQSPALKRRMRRMYSSLQLGDEPGFSAPYLENPNLADRIASPPGRLRGGIEHIVALPEGGVEVRGRVRASWRKYAPWVVILAKETRDGPVYLDCRPDPPDLYRTRTRSWRAVVPAGDIGETGVTVHAYALDEDSGSLWPLGDACPVIP